MCILLSCFNCVHIFETLWIIGCQAPLPMGFSRQEYWSGLPCPPAGNISNPEIESVSLTSPALTPPGKPKSTMHIPASPHCWISFPFRSPQSTEFPVLYGRFSFVICFIYTIVEYICRLQTPNSSHSSHLLGFQASVLYVCVSNCWITSCPTLGLVHSWN